MRRWLALAAAAVALSGCGGSSSLSLKQLRGDATRVCRTGAIRLNRIRTPTAPAGAQRFLNGGVAALTTELRQLRKLHVTGDAADVYLAAVNAVAAKLKAMKKSLAELNRSGDPVAALSALQRQLTPIEQTENGAWQSLGIPACANR